MSLSTGTRLGRYEIIAELGAGGMGEVYRARDHQLRRDVAIKVLPSHVTDDGVKRQRFEREAQAVAAVSHPHICALFDVGSPDPSTSTGLAVDFLVMEYLEGETLEQRLVRGALPLDDVLRCAIEMAGALDHAHRLGIVHRDLKPANVMLTSTGTKLLDFGLAKWCANDAITLTGGPRESRETESLTAEGTILGTVQYMAPEQVEGKEADQRADLFAFGAIVYEMVAGRSPFAGGSRASLMAAILTMEPTPLSAFEPLTPPGLDRIVKKCLAKDPDARWQTARDLLDALKWVAEGGSGARLPHTLLAATGAEVGVRQPATGPAPRRTNLLVGAVSLVLGAGLAGVASWMLMRSASPPPGPVRFTVTPDANQSPALRSVDRNVAMSPDGTRLVYETAGNPTSGLQVRAVDQLKPVHLEGTGGARWPFVSPDDRWIGFYTRTGAGTSQLSKVSITGGPPITLCEIQGTLWGASWGPDDTIVFATNDRPTGLIIVPAGGGLPKVLTRPDPQRGEFDHVLPFVLPGGRTVLFTIVAQRGVAETSRIAALDLETGRQTELIRGGGQAEYVETGHLMYAAAGTLRAVRFDPRRLEILSEPVPLVEQVLTKRDGTAAFSSSRSGALVYVTGAVVSSASFESTLVWVDRKGREEALTAPPREYVYPRVSPDGSRIALDIRDQENHIWIWNGARETLMRLTFDPVPDGSAVWTPDGTRVIFHSQRSGRQALHSQQVDGIGAVEQLTTHANPLAGYSVTPDGRQLIALESTMSGSDLTLVHLDGAPRTKPLIHTSFEEVNAEISPDGRWLAYESTELGQPEIYVRPFPNVTAGRWQVSIGGGRQPLWARNGRELFYNSPREQALMSVAIHSGSSFSNGNPVKVLETSAYLTAANGRSYDVSVDGRRFLMIKNPPLRGAAAQASAAMTVVLNWHEELKARLPVR